MLRFLKTLLIAASVAIIVIGAVQTAIELLLPDKSSAPPPAANDPNEPASGDRTEPADAHAAGSAAASHRTADARHHRPDR